MSIHNLQQRAAIFLVVIFSLGSPPSEARPQDESAPAAPPAGTVTDSRSSAPAYAPSEEIMNRLLEFYGAVLVARGGAIPPPGILFADQAAVATWQAGVATERATLVGTTIELRKSVV